MSSKKICFVSLGSYPLLAKKNINIVGGAELQQVILAKELKKRGYEISFIVFDHGQKSLEIINGIRAFKTFSSEQPVGLQFSKMNLIWKALDKTDADIYYLRSGVSGIVALYSLFKNKKFIYSIPSNMTLDRKWIRNPKFYDKYLKRIDIKQADCVIIQNSHQQKLLKNKFDKDGVIIKNICSHTVKNAMKTVPIVVLWVGTIRSEWKQPELFLKLAKMIPKVKFQMIGGPSTNKEFYKKIKYEASKIENLEFMGFVPYHKIDKYFEAASIFVNTSNVEGFPNTFIHAWARQMPVVSLNIDPDDIICKYKLGFHSKSFKQMISDLNLLIRDEKLRKELSENGINYINKEHNIEKIVTQYEKLFEKVF